MIEYSPALVGALSRADAALSELSGLGRVLPNPELLIVPYMNREAVASSRIEGTRADTSDLLLDQIAPSRTPADSDVREVRNYVAALKLGLDRLEKLPLVCRLVREMHAVLMDGVRGQEKSPGQFRREQNCIVADGATFEDAIYVPPPPGAEMMECLRHWEKFVNLRGQMPELIQCALIHEHFEAIHPFNDGNGRIGRLLIPLFLIERGRLSKPLLYVSNYIEQHRGAYYDCLQRIRTHGDWDSWFHYFLEAVRHSARAAISQSDKLLALQRRYREQFRTKHRVLALIEHLFVNPYTTPARAAKLLGCSIPTAKSAIEALVNGGLLIETTGRAWGRVWLAREILETTEPGAKSDST